MTNEKMLARLMEIVNALSPEDRETFTFAEKHPDDRWGLGAGCLLSNLCKDLRADIATETAKKSGKGAAFAAAKRICKAAFDNYNVTIHGAWTDEKGRQCVCDGYRFVRFVAAYDLPKLDEKFTPLDLEKCLASDMTQPLVLPDLSEVKAALKVWKAEHPKKRGATNTPGTYDFGDGLPMVNAQYLIDAMEALPGAEAYISASRGEKSGIYFKSEAGDGLLLPVNKMKTVAA